MNTLSLATTALAQTPSFWHAGRGPAAEQVAGPQLLRLRRLVQHARLDRRGQRLRARPAAEDRQRGQVGLHAPAAGRPGAEAVRGRGGDGVGSRRRPAEAALLHAAVPARLGRPDQAEGHASRSAAADARRHHHAHRRHRRPGRRPGAAGCSWSSSTRTGSAVTQQVPGLAGANLSLSPVQAAGSDPVVKQTTWTASTGTVTVPARTVAVLVQT